MRRAQHVVRYFASTLVGVKRSWLSWGGSSESELVSVMELCDGGDLLGFRNFMRSAYIGRVPGSRRGLDILKTSRVAEVFKAHWES